MPEMGKRFYRPFTGLDPCFAAVEPLVLPDLLASLHYAPVSTDRQSRAKRARHHQRDQSTPDPDVADHPTAQRAGTTAYMPLRASPSGGALQQLLCNQSQHDHDPSLQSITAAIAAKGRDAARVQTDTTRTFCASCCSKHTWTASGKSGLSAEPSVLVRYQVGAAVGLFVTVMHLRMVDSNSGPYVGRAAAVPRIQVALLGGGRSGATLSCQAYHSGLHLSPSPPAACGCLPAGAELLVYAPLLHFVIPCWPVSRMELV